MSYDLWFLLLFKKNYISFDLCYKEQTILVLQCKKAWTSIELRLHSFIKERKGDRMETSAMNHSNISELCHPAAHIS